MTDEYLDRKKPQTDPRDPEPTPPEPLDPGANPSPYPPGQTPT